MERQVSLDAAALSDDTPLRLKTAARLAFPDGSMTESGLQCEIKRGRLAFEKIANKVYTTLNDIKRMREQCRENQKGQGSISEGAPAGLASGLSSTDQLKSARDAASTIAQRLKSTSKGISPTSTGQTGSGEIPQR